MSECDEIADLKRKLAYLEKLNAHAVNRILRQISRKIQKTRILLTKRSKKWYMRTSHVALFFRSCNAGVRQYQFRGKEVQILWFYPKACKLIIYGLFRSVDCVVVLVFRCLVYLVECYSQNAFYKVYSGTVAFYGVQLNYEQFNWSGWSGLGKNWEKRRGET